MKFRRDSITIYRKQLIDKIESVGVNITQGGEAELRVNNRVVAKLPIGIQDTGRPEARPTGDRGRPRDVSN